MSTIETGWGNAVPDPMGGFAAGYGAWYVEAMRPVYGPPAPRPTAAEKLAKRIEVTRRQMWAAADWSPWRREYRGRLQGLLEAQRILEAYGE